MTGIRPEEPPMSPETAHPLFAEAQPARRNKIVTAAEAARLVMDGDTVATGGFIRIGFAENLAVALGERFVGEEPAPQTAAARHGGEDRAPQSSTGRSHASLPRHRCRQAGADLARRSRHLRR